ncbi:MAG: hypothetical protein AAGG48_15095 [Planctomycetota bacterium]
MNDLIDDQELQRLLDGSISNEDRVLLLDHAEEHPDNWRRIALAFVEEQVLRQELTSFAETTEWVAEPQATYLADDARDSHEHERSRWMVLICQAAVLCFMLGGAVWLGRESAAPTDAPMGSDVPADYTIVLTPQAVPGPASDAQQTPGPQSENPFDAETTLASGNGLTDVQLADMPLNDEVESMFTPLFDPESLSVIQDYGYTVNEEPVIYVVQGPEGEQYLLPRRNVSFVAHRE